MLGSWSVTSLPTLNLFLADILPLSKIYHLWDTVLMGTSSFPLCVGVAILQQLRGDLLSFGFNECILMFSDMPGQHNIPFYYAFLILICTSLTDIDIQQCINDAVRVYQTTPPSVCVREHEPVPSQHPSIPTTAVRN